LLRIRKVFPLPMDRLGVPDGEIFIFPTGYGFFDVAQSPKPPLGATSRPDSTAGYRANQLALVEYMEYMEYMHCMEYMEYMGYMEYMKYMEYME
jgi:hypothetical protein